MVITRATAPLRSRQRAGVAAKAVVIVDDQHRSRHGGIVAPERAVRIREGPD
jgi:hypothetical protein